jgi:L-ascorbate metabolism protein UlaG (beta-lactamase superfamily)
MSDKTLYRLADSTVAEPLVNQWVAWAHTLPPVVSSLHLKNYQIKLLESYLSDPRAHATACQNPKLRSGSFVDVPEARAAEVEKLLADTLVVQRDNLALAEEVIAFHNLLVREAQGQSLEPYYEMAPDGLRGYIELVYDYYNRPTVRLYESLLYESQYYQPNLQSIRLSRQQDESSRPFIMNTPRLAQGDQIDWRRAFASPEVDEFFKLDGMPQPLGYIREILGLSQSSDPLLLPLLSQAAVPAYARWSRPEVRIRSLGHASVLVEWNGVSVLTDPFIPSIPEGGSRVSRLTYKDLPEKIDYVVITHNHHDHFCLESLLRLRHRIGALVVPKSFGMLYGDLSLKILARKVGFKQVIELDALESIQVPGGEIIAIPFMGEHADLAHGKTGMLIRAGHEQILFAADSDCLDPQMYEHIRRIIGPIGTVFLGLECVGAPLSWSCGAFFPEKPHYRYEQTRRYKGCDSRRALALLDAVGASRIYIYAMGLEPWLEHLLGLAYSEDSLQLKEAHRLLAQARELDFAEAKLLFGQVDFTLPAGAPRAAISIPPSHAADQMEDHFAFE